MRVLADFHHHDLWESLELLFTDRLGWELYRPIGMEWFTEGYWNHERKWHGDAIARQYLQPWGDDDPERGRPDRSHPGRWQKLVTLDQARDLKFDLVLSTLAHNHEGFARFASEVGAVFALQIGNVRFGSADMAEDRWDLAAFGLVSGLMPVTPPKPHVVYHQEFSLHDFRYEPPASGSPLIISSFVQCFPENEMTYAHFRGIADVHPEFAWRVFGAYGAKEKDRYASGNLDTCASVGDAMRSSHIAWHAKQWSDGFGHVFHNWYAVGRPMLGFRDYYASQLGGALWLEGETAFDIGSRSPEEILALLRRFDEERDYLAEVSANAARRFREVVNYDAEEQAIRALLAQVLP